MYYYIKETLKPVPQKPHYLFNFKDITKVVQGLQLLASKSKVIPVKLTKKSKNKKNNCIYYNFSLFFF